MKVSEAIKQLQTFPQDLELRDEYAENEIMRFSLSEYNYYRSNSASYETREYAENETLGV
jgi:hypothetical protein